MIENQSAYDKMAAAYAEYEWSHPEVLQRSTARLLPYIQKNDRVLVVGCSAGRDSDFFIRKGFDVVSLDYSEELIKEAQKRVQGGIFFTMNLLDIKTALPQQLAQEGHLAPEAWEGLYCGSALQHLSTEESKRALQIFYNILADGGHAFISVKEGEEGALYKTEDFGVERTYCLHDQQKTLLTLESIGFSIIETFKDESLESYKPHWIGFIVRKDEHSSKQLH